MLDTSRKNVAKLNVSTSDDHACNVSADVKTTMVADDTFVVITKGSDDKKVMGLNPEHSLGAIQDNKLHLVQEKCRQQIGDQFGCIPLDQFVTYHGPDVHWKTIPDIFHAHRLIRDSGSFWACEYLYEQTLMYPIGKSI